MTQLRPILRCASAVLLSALIIPACSSAAPPPQSTIDPRDTAALQQLVDESHAYDDVPDDPALFILAARIRRLQQTAAINTLTADILTRELSENAFNVDPALLQAYIDRERASAADATVDAAKLADSATTQERAVLGESSAGAARIIDAVLWRDIRDEANRLLTDANASTADSTLLLTGVTLMLADDDDEGHGVAAAHVIDRLLAGGVHQ